MVASFVLCVLAFLLLCLTCAFFVFVLGRFFCAAFIFFFDVLLVHPFRVVQVFCRRTVRRSGWGSAWWTWHLPVATVVAVATVAAVAAVVVQTVVCDALIGCVVVGQRCRKVLL